MRAKHSRPEWAETENGGWKLENRDGKPRAELEPAATPGRYLLRYSDGLTIQVSASQLDTYKTILLNTVLAETGDG